MVLKIHVVSVLRLAMGAGITLALAALGGCGVTYLAQAAHGQLSVMHARQPIDKVLAHPDTGDSLRTQLLRVKRIRDFASRELGLPDNASYRSYADIHRPYVVWNVVAAPELSVEPRRWCFPVAGCVAYRGYFDEASARKFAARLQAQGDDVTVGGVSTYSTLGRVADPVLSTVAGYGELDLAGLIFHELAHQQLYVAGDSSFSEAFAVTVEDAGVARYAQSLGDAPALQRWQARRRLRAEVSAQFSATRSQLAQLFASKVTDEQKRAGKAKLLQGLTAQIRDTAKRQGRPTGFEDWLDAGLNNAHLASVATYYEMVPRLEQVLHDKCGDYLPCFYVTAKPAAPAKGTAGR
jgi:predicted aminopeptidase